jgi:hypothetical protein
MEHALRLRDGKEFDKLEYVIASMAGGYTRRAGSSTASTPSGR